MSDATTTTPDPEATLVHDAHAPSGTALAWDVTMAPGMVAWHWRRMLRTMPALAMAPPLAPAEDHTLHLHRPAPDPGLSLSAGELATDAPHAWGWAAPEPGARLVPQGWAGRSPFGPSHLAPVRDARAPGRSRAPRPQDAPGAIASDPPV